MENENQVINTTENSTTPEVDRSNEQRPSLIEQADLSAEKLKEQNDRREMLLGREEALLARRALGGTSEGGFGEIKPKVLTDIEKAEMVERGELNPLQADGFI